MDRKLLWVAVLAFTTVSSLLQFWMYRNAREAMGGLVGLQHLFGLAAQGSIWPLLVFVLQYVFSWASSIVIWICALVQLGHLESFSATFRSASSRVGRLGRILGALLVLALVESIVSIERPLYGIIFGSLNSSSIPDIFGSTELLRYLARSMPFAYLGSVLDFAIMFVFPLTLVSNETFIALFKRNILVWLRLILVWFAFALVPIVINVVVQLPTLLVLLNTKEMDALARSFLLFGSGAIGVFVGTLIEPWWWLSQASAFSHAFLAGRENQPATSVA